MLELNEREVAIILDWFDEAGGNFTYGQEETDDDSRLAHKLKTYMKENE